MAELKPKVLVGAKRDIFVKKSVGEYFWDVAQKYGDRVCQIDAYTDKKETFHTVCQRAIKVAIQLKKLGVKPKDTVMLCCRNNLDNLIPALAALFIGAYVSSVDPMLDSFDIQYMIMEVSPKIIFVIDECLSLIEQSIMDEAYLCVIGKTNTHYFNLANWETTEINANEDNLFKPICIDVHETAFILFTGGTTSIPKAIRFSHLSALHLVINGEEIDFNNTVPIIQNKSLYTISSIWCMLLCALSAKPRIVAEHLDAESVLKLVEKYQIEFLTIFVGRLNDFIDLSTTEKWKSFKTSSLRLVTPFGGNVKANRMEKLRSLFPHASVTQLYTSTEIGTLPTQWPLDSPFCTDPLKSASVGIVNDNVEIKIVDLDKHTLVPPRQRGEILIKSPYRMNGYATGDSSDVFDDDGFLKTGDYGYYDEDDFLYVEDRVNEIFKYQEYRISPSRIEEQLYNLDAVKEAVVIGLPHEIDNHHPAACIVLKSSSTEAEILQYIKENMDDQYYLRGGIRFVDKIPRTPTGVLSRRAVRKLFNVSFY